MKERLYAIFLLLFFLMSGLELYAVPVRIAVPALGEGLLKLKQWTPLVKTLEEQCGIEINLVIVRDNAVIEKGLQDHYYDLAFVDSFWYFLWKEKNFCTPLVQAETGGTSMRRILLVVNKDSIIRRLEDLRGASIAFTLKDESAAGFYLPLAMLLQEGIAPFRYFKESVFAETFQSILKGVAYGKLDAGFITSGIYNRKENTYLTDSLRILLASGLVPGWILIGRKGFNSSVTADIDTVLLSLSRSTEGKAVLSTSGFTGFIRASEKNFYQLGKYVKLLEKNHAAPE